MPPPTNPGDVIIVGQRRREPTEPFPERPQIVTFEGMFDELDPDPGTEPDPCADPATALEWNADAAAAEAAKAFARKAAEQVPPEDLNTREWGAYLYRNLDGSVRVGRINPGPTFTSGGVGSVPLIDDGAPTDIVGFVHSHGDGNHLPSDGPPDNPGDIEILDQVISYSQNPTVQMYIVARNQLPVGSTPYNQINIYDKSNARSARDSFSAGPEVNPEGRPCPN